MRAEQFLIPVIAITRRRSALAVVGRVAPAILDALVTLVVDEIHFRQVAGSNGDFVCRGIIGHTVEMRPVRPGPGIADTGHKLVDINLIRPGADVIPHGPFPNHLAGAVFDFPHHVGPDALNNLLAVLQPLPEQIASGRVRCQALGQSILIRILFPDQNQQIAVGHHFKGMVGNFLIGNIAFVFPYLFPVPVELLEQSGLPAEGRLHAGQRRMTDQVAVGHQFRIKAAVVAFPLVDHVAVHVHQIGDVGLLRRYQSIAVKRAWCLVQQPQRPLERLIRLRASGQSQRGDARRHNSG